MARKQPTGELYPRHIKALRELIRAYEASFPGSALTEPAKQAMREVREIAKGQQIDRRHRGPGSYGMI